MEAEAGFFLFDQRLPIFPNTYATEFVEILLQDARYLSAGKMCVTAKCAVHSRYTGKSGDPCGSWIDVLGPRL